MSDAQIPLPMDSLVEAMERLENALGRLEQAAAPRSIEESAQTDRVADLERENAALRDVHDVVVQRLETAMGRLRQLLGE